MNIKFEYIFHPLITSPEQPVLLEPEMSLKRVELVALHVVNTDPASVVACCPRGFDLAVFQISRYLNYATY